MVSLKHLITDKSFRRGLHFHGKSRSIKNEVSVKSLPYIEFDVGEAVKQLESAKNVKVDTYASVLETCARSKLLEEGKAVHHHMLKNGSTIRKNPLLLEKVACMYINCGEIELARLVFDEIRGPSIFMWNSMIRGYAWNGPFERAIDLYDRMVHLGVRPNKFTFPFVLKACAALLALGDAKKIHRHAKSTGFDCDLFVSTALVDLYAKCGCLDDACDVFNKMPQKDVVAWNALIAGSVLHGLYNDAIDLVFEMLKEGTSLNSSTVVAILPAVGMAKNLLQGKSIHGYCIRRRISTWDVLLGTALLDMYGKCECLDYSQKFFQFIRAKNEVTWSAMIGVYALHDKMAEALLVFGKLVNEESLNPTSATLSTILKACSKLTNLNMGTLVHAYSVKSGFFWDITVRNSLLSMYSKSGAPNDAIRLFDEMEVKDTVSYGAVISGCVQNGNAQEALLMFRKMQLGGTEPDIATMVALIPACAHVAALEHGRASHGFIVVSGFACEVSISNSLIDMYSKCGRIDMAREVFNRMPECDIVSWNAIIAGYGLHGLGFEALSLFHNMHSNGLKPDGVTFICLLNACSHSGLVIEGKNCFCEMEQHFKIVPRMEHYICMVDLLGRAGHLDEAYKFIGAMPFESDIRVWGALLGACRVHKNIELGEEVSKTIQKLGPEGTGNFVLMSNIYSAAGRWHDAANIRILQKNKGLRKSPGSSWIEIDRTVHAFVGGDRSHAQTVSIYARLEELLGEMKRLGYEADTTFVLHDVEEEEKEHILLYHSEKLAIAFGILMLAPGKPIIVTKNLRICSDCHTVIKFISVITKRTITVRDVSRFHHFSYGSCNCGDFW
ncbi:pentatricopeptide repeat-containing protein At3g16610 [Aristolochia californica]|uniref:pentatricopeptide repeat-containing protein At3g16610 n=1 Tax=Aristolochia californica TaxID=171875 RepID=UPI0035DDC39B